MKDEWIGSTSQQATPHKRQVIRAKFSEVIKNEGQRIVQLGLWSEGDVENGKYSLLNQKLWRRYLLLASVRETLLGHKRFEDLPPMEDAASDAAAGKEYQALSQDPESHEDAMEEQNVSGANNSNDHQGHIDPENMTAVTFAQVQHLATQVEHCSGRVRHLSETM